VSQLKVNKILKTVPKLKAAAEESLPALTLPTERNAPCRTLQEYTILLYGAKKIGKTTLASLFPKAFFMLCEPGGKALEIYARPVKTWDDFKAYNRLLVKDKTFENVIIDTVDHAYEMCMRWVCRKMVIDHPSDSEWGKGWNAVKVELQSEFNKLMHSGKGVVLISHAREEEIKKRDGSKFNRTSSTLGGQAKEFFEGVVDVWAYYTYEGARRVLVVQGDDFIDAGHRIKKHFCYPDGTAIRKIPMGVSEEEAYKNFVAAFENRLPKPGVAVPAAKPKLILKK
jgi:hypothetical protein